MPVYNSGIYLRAAVESILCQSLKEIELILVDDGSTDGSSQLCDEYANKDNRVVVIHEKNGGICTARNAALAIAQGEYIGFSDHDDETFKETFEKAYTFAKKNDLDIVKYGHFEIMTRGTDILKDRVYGFKEAIYSSEEVGKHYLQMLKDMAMDCIWDGLFKRSFLYKNNLLLDTRFKTGGEDIDFCGRVISCKPRLGLMPDIFYHHYIRVGFSTSSKFSPLNVHNAMTFPNRLNSYLANYNPTEIYKDNPILYAFTIVRRCIGPILYCTASKACDWKSNKVTALLKEVKANKAIDPIFFSVSKLDMMKYSKKYGLLYSLYTFGLYRLCMKLYQTHVN